MEPLQDKTSTGQRWFVRPGRREDCAAVHALIVELAVYEREPDAVVVTVADLEADGFGPDAIFDLFVAEEAGEVIGMALVYEKYSTWKGRCLYLEDFVVTASRRGECCIMARASGTQASSCRAGPLSCTGAATACRCGRLRWQSPWLAAGTRCDCPRSRPRSPQSG